MPEGQVKGRGTFIYYEKNINHPNNDIISTEPKRPGITRD